MTDTAPATNSQPTAASTQAPEIEGEVLKYTGASFLVGVPARTLTAFEFQQFDIPTQWEIIRSNLYEWGMSEPVNESADPARGETLVGEREDVESFLNRKEA
jgi:hypothetical protein